MPYISYQLKDTTVKILGLEKKLNLWFFNFFSAIFQYPNKTVYR
jgi:hypothetical protein